MRILKIIFFSYGTIAGVIFSIVLIVGNNIMDKRIGPNMTYNFTVESLVNDITKIVTDSLNNKNLQGFFNAFTDVDDRTFLEEAISQDSVSKSIIILIDTTQFESFLKLHLICKKQYPHSITGSIIVQKNNWSDNTVVNIIILVIGFLFPAVTIGSTEQLLNSSRDLNSQKEELNKSVINAIDEWKKKEVDEGRNIISSEIMKINQTIDERFTDTITSFTIAHKGFIHGMYGNYPHNFTTVFDEHKSDFIKEKGGINSAYIWMGNIKGEDYAAFSIDLLSLTKSSIKSTSYYKNTAFIKLLKDRKLNNWLSSVNKKKVVDPNFYIARVHVFNDSDQTRNSKYFIRCIKEDKNRTAKQYYKELYANDQIDKYEVWQLNGSIIFYGEYIIFDDQVLLKYDSDFEVLELFIGDVVKNHARSFAITEDQEGNYFDIETRSKILKTLDE